MLPHTFESNLGENVGKIVLQAVPLRLAWYSFIPSYCYDEQSTIFMRATTIHKSQGMTLDSVIMILFFQWMIFSGYIFLSREKL